MKNLLKISLIGLALAISGCDSEPYSAKANKAENYLRNLVYYRTRHGIVYAVVVPTNQNQTSFSIAIVPENEVDKIPKRMIVDERVNLDDPK